MRIKYKLLEKMIGLTNREMDFLLYVARHQDPEGNIIGVYYDDVCKQADMCKQTFYSCLKSLQDKGLITYTKNTDIDYDLKILNNDFSYKESYKEGYINLNRKVFRRGRFKKLKANEKWLLLEFLKITHSAGGSHQIGTKNFYEKYEEILNVSTRVLRYYLHSLKFFFHIGIKDKKYFITYIAQIFNERSDEHEEEQYLWQRIRVCCRREKVKDVKERDVRDSANLVTQYRNLAQISNQDIISILLQAVKLSVQEQANKRLHRKYVHKILRRELGLI